MSPQLGGIEHKYQNPVISFDLEKGGGLPKIAP